MASASVSPEKVLKGIKVANFAQAVAGALGASILACYGATVIKIESTTRLDWMRQSEPFIGNAQTPDNAVPFMAANCGGQYGVTLNFAHPQGKEVARKIVRWADVVIENFAGGVMAKAGLGYDDLRKVNPNIIMLSASIYGESGPFSRVRGFGSTLTALTGFPHLTGFPDEPPQLPSAAFTDYISPRIMVLAIMAALDHRRATGEGQYIDSAQLEAAIPLLTPVLLDCEVNGRELGRVGNKSPFMAPHGVYPCKGDDRWCTISVSSDEEWERFCVVIGSPPWTKEPIFNSVLERVKNSDALDTFVAQWTVCHSPETVMYLMQEQGISAGIVQTGKDLAQDPHLDDREFFVEVDNPGIGTFSYTGMTARLSETPYEIKRSPRLGEHNEYVYTKLLGISDEEFVHLYSEGVFE